MAEQDRDQQTEEATPRRIQKAREDGQLAMSQEFLGGMIMVASVLLFWGFGYHLFVTLGETIVTRTTLFETVITDPDQLVAALRIDATKVGIACLIFLIPIVLVAGFGGLLQTKFNISLKPLHLDLNKLSVKSGVAKIFSSKSVVRGAFSVVKAAIILATVYFVAKSRLVEIANSGFGSFRDLMFLTAGILLSASIAIVVMMFVVGVLDLAFQKWKHLEELKMSVRDIKDENKESDGDPLVRARIKRLQAEMGRKRMLADVPKASVVITNPTHFAVAIQYDGETMDAPIVLAKGADFMAKKIIEIANEHGVAVVERKPVARFLFANTDIGQPVPIELYQAIAEVLNFVNRVRAA